MNTPVPSFAELSEFKKLYKKDFGWDITDEDAIRKLIGLLHILPIVATPEELEQMGGSKFVLDSKHS